MKGIAMKKLARILTMGGFGVLAAVATGAGAAQAAAPHGPAEHKAPAAHQIDWRGDDQIVGFYRTLPDCELAGNFGERVGNWDDHDCSIVRIGVRQGAWALRVASEDDWNRGGFGVPFRAIHGFPVRFRPVWPGVFRPGMPGPVFGHGGFGGPGFGHGGPGFGHGGPGFGHGGPGFGHEGPGFGHEGPGFGHGGPVFGHGGGGFGHGGPVIVHPGPVIVHAGPGAGQPGPGAGQAGPGAGHAGPGAGQAGPGAGQPGGPRH
jgi:hypothetical protein